MTLSVVTCLVIGLLIWLAIGTEPVELGRALVVEHGLLSVGGVGGPVCVPHLKLFQDFFVFFDLLSCVAFQISIFYVTKVLLLVAQTLQHEGGRILGSHSVPGSTSVE